MTMTIPLATRFSGTMRGKAPMRAEPWPQRGEVEFDVTDELNLLERQYALSQVSIRGFISRWISTLSPHAHAFVVALDALSDMHCMARGAGAVVSYHSNMGRWLHYITAPTPAFKLVAVDGELGRPGQAKT